MRTSEGWTERSSGRGPGRRLLALLASSTAALAAVVTLSTAATVAPAAAVERAPHVLTGSLPAASDFATNTWSDPWDFSNSSDLLLDPKGPTLGFVNQKISGGLVSFDVVSNGYLSPLFTGYQGALYQGRDGALDQNSIDASRYTKLSMQVYASQATSAGIFWFGCVNQSTCEGGMPLSLEAGWNTYVLTLANNPAYKLPQAWSGRIRGMRVAINPANGSPVHINIDWIRLYTPNPSLNVGAAPVHWAIPSMSGEPQGAGTLPDGDASALPPGSYRVTTADGASAPLTLLAPPAPTVLSPDATGMSSGTCVAWTMRSAKDVARLVNATALSYTGGLNGRNAGPTMNDPQVWLHMPAGGIDGTQLHRITVTFHNDRPFDLTNSPNGGTMARVMWYDAAHGPNTTIQTKDWVTYGSRITTTLDLAGPADNLFEETRGNRYPWGSSKITALRWDPDEATGAVTWHLTDVHLCSDDQPVGGVVTIKWSQATAGTATLALAGQSAPIVVLPDQAAGVHSYSWRPPATLGATAPVTVTVAGPGGTQTATSSGPVKITATARACPTYRTVTGAPRWGASVACPATAWSGSGRPAVSRSWGRPRW